MPLGQEGAFFVIVLARQSFQDVCAISAIVRERILKSVPDSHSTNNHEPRLKVSCHMPPPFELT